MLKWPSTNTSSSPGLCTRWYRPRSIVSPLEKVRPPSYPPSPLHISPFYNSCRDNEPKVNNVLGQTLMGHTTFQNSNLDKTRSHEGISGYYTIIRVFNYSSHRCSER